METTIWGIGLRVQLQGLGFRVNLYEMASVFNLDEVPEQLPSRFDLVAPPWPEGNAAGRCAVQR